jgi:hypothetical protein
MREENKYTVFIDTSSDKTQNPSKFKIKLNNWFMRNNIKNSDSSKKDWYISVKSLAILNSFSNVSRGINDSIDIYEQITPGATAPNVNANVMAHYKLYSIVLDEGNPNVASLQKQINDKLTAEGLVDIKFSYSSYNSKFTVSINNANTKVFYIHFKNSFELFGFEKDVYYLLFLGGNNESAVSYTNVNLLSDRLIKFELAPNSDFRIKNTHYSNITYGWFQDCNIFHLQPVNVDPYRLIYYTRSTNELLPIELHKNSITDFQINVINQDSDDIEGLAHWIMVLEFTQVKTWNYDIKIYNVIKEMYLWIAMFFRNKI